MKKQLLTAALVASLALAFTACGKETQLTESSTTEQTSDTETDVFAEGNHDAAVKDNNYKSAITTAKKVSKGSTDMISGKYNAHGVTYTFDNGTATIVMDGSYEFTSDGIKLSYTGMEEKSYKITETDSGFNLIADGTLLPLVYMSGTDGLTGKNAFSGVYSMGSQGYVFTSDGKLTVVNVYDDLEVEKDSISFAGQTYDYRTEGDGIVLSTNGTDVMTLVP